MPTRRELANAIRALSMDAVQKANSGHPGAPLGMADIAEVLWREVLKFNPGNPLWLDRGCKVRLVSMPSTTSFDRQDQAYKDSVLPPSVSRRVAVDAGARQPWWRYVGLNVLAD